MPRTRNCSSITLFKDCRLHISKNAYLSTTLRDAKPSSVNPVNTNSCCHKSFSYIQQSKPRLVPVWIVLLLWQLRSFIPKISTQVRSKKGTFWANCLLQVSRTSTSCLWILRQCEMWRLQSTRPVGNTLSADIMSMLDVPTAVDTACKGIDAQQFRRRTSLGVQLSPTWCKGLFMAWTSGSTGCLQLLWSSFAFFLELDLLFRVHVNRFVCFFNIHWRSFLSYYNDSTTSR